MAEKKRNYTEQALLNLQNEWRLVSNDIDSIKHQVRHAHNKLDAISRHLKIEVPPDEMELAVNPSASFINEVLQEVRGGAASKSAEVAEVHQQVIECNEVFMRKSAEVKMRKSTYIPVGKYAVRTSAERERAAGSVRPHGGPRLRLGHSAQRPGGVG